MKVFYGLLFVIVVMAIVGAYLHDKNHDEFRQACDARGGQALFLERDRYCVDKGVFR